MNDCFVSNIVLVCTCGRVCTCVSSCVRLQMYRWGSVCECAEASE